MQVWEWLNNWSEGLSETESKLLISIILMVLIWIIKSVVVNSINKINTDVANKYRWRKNATYMMYAVGLISIIFIWSNRFASFATFLGLVSAGLAIAFKDPIANIAAWYYILADKPFKVGDRVEIDHHIGDIIDISLFQITMIEIRNWVQADQSTGRIIHVPNSKVFNQSVMNYSTLVGHLWNEIRLPLTLDSNWRRAKEVMEAILQTHAPVLSEDVYKELEELSDKYMITASKLSPIVFTSIEDNGIVLTMRYMCPIRQRRASANTLYEEILTQLGPLKDVRFSYNTLRILNEERYSVK